MTNILKSVADSLGATFDGGKYSNCDYFAPRGYITMPDGVTFFVITGDYGNKDKIVISPSYPDSIEDSSGKMRYTGQRSFDNSLHYPDTGFSGIKVSNTKTPEQIAKDITRRFLSVYNPLYAMSLEYCKHRKEYYSKQGYLENLAKELLQPFVYRGETSFKALIRTVSSGKVSISIDDLDEKELRDLAAFLKTL